ncbi:hypothetical protein [Candidatus Poriferisodalis sp.]|uniref:hypothetical protein n=1 Tax=Candidatus Poriferisodalis sp. TaxID=3101277 RepID=UPI003B5B1E03
MSAGHTDPQPIAVELLDLDRENPRHGEVESQDLALARLIEDQGVKLVNIAVDIHASGLHIADLFIVLKADDGRYTVLDGNRRLAALRLLRTPSLLPDEVRTPDFNAAVANSGNQPETVTCAVVATRSEARLWLERTHSGELEGVGTVSWGSTAKQRFRAAVAGTPNTQTSKALVILDWLRRKLPSDHPAHTHLDAVERGRVTNLGRLAGDPYVRSRVGFEFAGDTISLRAEVDTVVDRLAHVVKDLATGTTVTTLKRKHDRARYIDQLLYGEEGEEPPDPQLTLDVGREPVSEAGSESPSTTTDGETSADDSSASTTSSRLRRTQPIAHPFSEVDTTGLLPRTRQVVNELATLNPNIHPNAIAVLQRCVVELSVVQFLKSRGQSVSKSARLAQLVRAALKELGIADDDQRFHAVQTHLQNASSVMSVRHLHEYVHNADTAPGESDLNSIAIGYRPLLEEICTALRSG